MHCHSAALSEPSFFGRGVAHRGASPLRSAGRWGWCAVLCSKDPGQGSNEVTLNLFGTSEKRPTFVRHHTSRSPMSPGRLFNVHGIEVKEFLTSNDPKCYCKKPGCSRESACCQFACIAPATNQVDTGHKNDETSRESGKPAGWIELKSILPGGNLMIFNGLHSCQHVQKAPSMDWLITVTRRRKRMETMMICPQPAMISKDPGCSKRRCRCCAPPWPSIGGSKNGRIMEDMLKTRVTWFIMFNMNVSSTMVYHHSIMFFMFPHWLSNLRSINYCIFYQMYGRKYVVFFFLTAGQKRQSMGFHWIHWLGGTLKVASACLVADLLKRKWTPDVGPHTGTELPRLDIYDGWITVKICENHSFHPGIHGLPMVAR